MKLFPKPHALKRSSSVSSMRQVLRHGQCLLVYPSAFEKHTPQGMCGTNPLMKPHPEFNWSPVIRTPAQIGIPYIAPLLRTPDGVHLTCYLLPQTTSSLRGQHRSKSMAGQGSRTRSTRGIEDERIELTLAAEEATATVLVFHGNAAHNWEDMESAQDLFRMGCNVFLASYRGCVS